MTDIMNIIVSNLIMVGVFLILFVLFRVADILFGIAIAKKKDVNFDVNKFLWGIFYTLSATVGLACLVAGVSLIIPLINYYQIIVDDTVTSVLNSINSIAICGTIIVASVAGYGKDAFSKVKTLLEK